MVMWKSEIAAQSKTIGVEVLYCHHLTQRLLADFAKGNASCLSFFCLFSIVFIFVL